jgi:hypothetical protein
MRCGVSMCPSGMVVDCRPTRVKYNNNNNKKGKSQKQPKGLKMSWLSLIVPVVVVVVYKTLRTPSHHANVTTGNQS